MTEKTPGRTIFLASPHGMCAGVRRAVAVAQKVLAASPEEPVCFLHELVHNRHVTEKLQKAGAVLAEQVSEIPENAIVFFSAHGVSEAVEREAEKRHLRIVDAGCPLVKKLHRAAEKHTGVLLIAGHKDHPEVVGICGRGKHVFTGVAATAEEAEKMPDFPAGIPVLMLSQTTFNLDVLAEIRAVWQKKYPQLQCEASVCYATEHRQKAIRVLAGKTKLILIIGSPKSSNSNRLCELAKRGGAEVFLIDDPAELPLALLQNASSVGVGAGASTPEESVREIMDILQRQGFDHVVTVGEDCPEGTFPLPEINLNMR